MKKRMFPIMAVLVMVLTVFAVSVQAESISPGIAAYTSIPLDEGQTVDLYTLKSAFLTIEYEEAGLFLGTLDLAPYEPVYDPLVLVKSDGTIVAFYLESDPAAKIVDVRSKNLDETLLEKAVKTVAIAADPYVDTDTLTISHYDYGNPTATKMLLVAGYEPVDNVFSLQFDSTETEGNTYYEKSYAFYRTYGPSFTFENEFTLEPVEFVDESADYFGEGFYDTIYDHFPVMVGEDVIDFDPEVENYFTVDAGDGLGFGALAILYSGDFSYTVMLSDIYEDIALSSPGIDLDFDLVPGAFTKAIPGNGVENVELDPVLFWHESTVPNYQYCIDTIDNSECDTEWVSSIGIAPSAALENLLYETTYYWQVRAVNNFGITYADGGIWWSFTTDDGIAPLDFSKGEASLTQPIGSLSKVTLSWGTSYGAYHYEVCFADSSDYLCTAETALYENVGLATSVTFDELELETTYNWQVRAVNDFDTTYADSGTLDSFTTRTFSKLRPLPDEVYNLTLPFKWEESTLATEGYDYCIIEDTELPPECNTSVNEAEWVHVSGTSVVVKNLSAGTYYWQVRRSGSDVEANDDVWWKFSVLSKRDSKKINLFKVSPVDGALDQITSPELSWRTTLKTKPNPTPRTLTYEYCYFTGEIDTCSYGGIWTSTLVLSATIEGLAYNTTYSWQVRTNLGTEEKPDWLYADNGNFWEFTTELEEVTEP